MTRATPSSTGTGTSPHSLTADASEAADDDGRAAGCSVRGKAGHGAGFEDLELGFDPEGKGFVLSPELHDLVGGGAGVGGDGVVDDGGEGVRGRGRGEEGVEAGGGKGWGWTGEGGASSCSREVEVEWGDAQVRALGVAAALGTEERGEDVAEGLDGGGVGRVHGG